MILTSVSKFQINYRPLNVGYDLEVVSDVTEDCDGVDDMQQYDAMAGCYYPDYRIFPLVIQPSVYVSDPDKILGDGLVYVTKDVANVSWYETEGGVRKLIDPSNTNYEITQSGEQKGRLKVKRNISPQNPITLTYTAQYLDPRTNEVYTIEMTHFLRCMVIQKPCVLKTDCPSLVDFNPYSEDKVYHINAKVFSGTKEVVANLRKCVWKILSNDGRTELDPSDPNNVTTWFAEVSADTMTLDVNMEFMGRECHVYCYGITTDDPSRLASLGAGNAFEKLEIRFRRRIPHFKTSIQRMPNEIPSNLKYINPKGVVVFNKFSTDNPEQELKPKWRMWGQNNGSQQVSVTVLGSGMSQTISTELAATNRMQGVEFEVEDRGEYKYLTDGSGTPITDGSGRLIMVR